MDLLDFSLIEKEQLPLNLKYSQKALHDFVKKIKSPIDTSIWSQPHLKQIFLLAFSALKKALISESEAISVCLLLGAWRELVEDHSFYVSFDDLYNDDVKREAGPRIFGVKIPLSEQSERILQEHIMKKLNYDMPGVIRDHTLFPGTYQQFAHRVYAIYGKQESIPLLQKFFYLNDEQWKTFKRLMKKEKEQSIFLFALPQMGCRMSLLHRFRKTLRCFVPVKYFYFSKQFGEVTYKETFIVPSFSCIKNYLLVIANTYHRNPLVLTPHFGPLTEEQFEDLKRRNRTPLGLYYPLKDTMNQHFKEIDGWPGNALSFAFHDLFHAINELSMSDELSQARFRVVDLLRHYTLYNEKVDFIVKYLIDLAPLFSYDYKKSFFLFDRGPEKFGTIFHHALFKGCWDQNLITYVIKDMVKNKILWKKRFGIGLDDLHEPERTLYLKLEDVYDQ